MTGVAPIRFAFAGQLLAACVISGLAAGPFLDAQTKEVAPAAVRKQQPDSGKLVLYAGVGSEFVQYGVDAQRGTLVKQSSVTLPGAVQYVWPHPSRRYLYVAWTNNGQRQHGVTAFRVNPASGALQILGSPLSLRWRPIHVTTDIPGTHILVAYNIPSGITVHRIAADGSIGSQVDQPAKLDTGVYAHQIRVDASDKMVILVTRGNGPTADKPEDPGALKVFRYDNGILTNRDSIAPEGGINFQPRHLDFHPTRPWVFVSLERQNKLQVYEKLGNGTLSATPRFVKESLAGGRSSDPDQMASAIHVHPNGRFVYQANRSSKSTEFQGKRVSAGGENSIAVYAINQSTGEPTLIQNMDTRGFVPRTFSLDPDGRILVVGNQTPSNVREGNKVITVPANLSVFRIRADGKLKFIRKYDVETGAGSSLFWMGIMKLP
ncbi:MAG TPA: beta-propeller fold lactonase family protein [Bryobacteraceae bacterium]|nr:beta-propeller fold lactonase family protein [Bryobacteraceae bacterium]